MFGHATRCTRPLTHWELQYIAQALNIDERDAKKIYKDFVQTAGHDGRLSKREFRKLYRKVYPASRLTKRQLHRLTNKAYQLCDWDNSGKLTFNEFIAVLVLFEGRGSPRDKLHFFMSSTSVDGNLGRIPADGARRIMSSFDDIFHTNASAGMMSQMSLCSDDDGFDSEAVLSAFESSDFNSAMAECAFSSSDNESDSD